MPATAAAPRARELAAIGAEAPGEVGAELAARAWVAVVDRAATHAEIHQREGDGAARAAGAQQQHRLAAHGVGAERLDEGARGSRSGRCCGRWCGRPRRTPQCSPRRSRRASGETSSSSGITASLNGIGDVDAGEARRARRGQQILEAAARAGCRHPSGGSDRRSRRPRRHPRAAPATATCRYWRRSGRPACVTLWPLRRAPVRRPGRAGRCVDRRGCSSAVSSMRVWPCSSTRP